MTFQTRQQYEVDVSLHNGEKVTLTLETLQTRSFDQDKPLVWIYDGYYRSVNTISRSSLTITTFQCVGSRLSSGESWRGRHPVFQGDKMAFIQWPTGASSLLRIAETYSDDLGKVYLAIELYYYGNNRGDPTNFRAVLSYGVNPQALQPMMVNSFQIYSTNNIPFVVSATISPDKKTTPVKREDFKATTSVDPSIREMENQLAHIESFLESAFPHHRRRI